MSSVLVTYSSASGVTAQLANTLAGAIGADLREGRRFSARISVAELKAWAERF